MKFNLSFRWFIIPSLLVVIYTFTSCILYEQRRLPDMYIRESYQINNASSHDISLRFYREGKPYTIYAETCDQESPIFVTPENAKKEIKLLSNDSILSLKAGQTALFYEPINETMRDNPQATCLHISGSGSTFFNIFRGAINLIGDTVAIQSVGASDSIVSINNKDLWETWYDEKNYIYYHFWRIE